MAQGRGCDGPQRQASRGGRRGRRRPWFDPSPCCTGLSSAKTCRWRDSAQRQVNALCGHRPTRGGHGQCRRKRTWTYGGGRATIHPGKNQPFWVAGSGRTRPKPATGAVLRAGRNLSFSGHSATRGAGSSSFSACRVPAGPAQALRGPIPLGCESVASTGEIARIPQRVWTD